MAPINDQLCNPESWDTCDQCYAREVVLAFILAFEFKLFHFMRDICWDYKDELGIEKKHGFSKISGGEFVCDAIKTMLISILGYCALAPIIVIIFM